MIDLYGQAISYRPAGSNCILEITVAEQIAALTEEQLAALCGRPEDQFFDRKSDQCSGRKAQRTAAAFGNAEGGEIAIGIKDDDEELDPARRPSPFAKPEDANGILQALYDVNPPLTFRYAFASMPDGSG